MLEDTETGDIVCPLVYLREVFGLNYSRKTSNDRTRVIHEVPDGLVRAPAMTAQNLIQQQLMRARQQQVTGRPTQTPAEPVPCWKLPFESSTDVKLQIRELLGDEGFSKGHVRLVALPLAFNVLSEKDEFRDSALFRAVHHVLKNTTYAPLLRRRRPAPTPESFDNGNQRRRGGRLGRVGGGGGGDDDDDDGQRLRSRRLRPAASRRRHRRGRAGEAAEGSGQRRLAQRSGAGRRRVGERSSRRAEGPAGHADELR